MWGRPPFDRLRAGSRLSSRAKQAYLASALRTVSVPSVGLSAPRCLSLLQFLFLEQIIKRRPGIARPQTSRRRSLLLPRHPDLVGRTLIPRILLRHTFLDRLHTLKPASRIEIHALLAGMQFKPALWALPVAGHPLQHRSALRTSRHRPRSRHIDRPRPKCIVALRRRRRARLLSRPLAFLAIAVLITMLTVFGCHRSSQARDVLSRRRPPPGKYQCTRADGCHSKQAFPQPIFFAALAEFLSELSGQAF